MDTRSKIIDAKQALLLLKDKPFRRVKGSFDPLLAEQVRRLRQHLVEGELMVVEVTNPPNSLISQQARAELVAALEFVDFVVINYGPSVSPTINDGDVTEGFVQHVLRRHKEEQSG